MKAAPAPISTSATRAIMPIGSARPARLNERMHATTSSAAAAPAVHTERLGNHAAGSIATIRPSASDMTTCCPDTHCSANYELWHPMEPARAVDELWIRPPAPQAALQQYGNIVPRCPR